jgi:hypothetical protein
MVMIILHLLMKIIRVKYGSGRSRAGSMYMTRIPKKQYGMERAPTVKKGWYKMNFGVLLKPAKALFG